MHNDNAHIYLCLYTKSYKLLYNIVPLWYYHNSQPVCFKHSKTSVHTLVNTNIIVGFWNVAKVIF